MRRLLLTVACLATFQAAIADCNEDAEKLRLEGRVEESIVMLSECMTNELGRAARTWLLLGLANHDKGDEATAIENYSRAIRVEPQFASAFANRGVSHAIRKDFKSAMSDLNHAVELQPEGFEPYYLRGNVHERMKRDEEALADYEQALAFATDDEQRALVFYRRALVYNSEGNSELARADLDAAIQRAPGLADAYLARAGIAQQAGDLDTALDDLTKAIEFDPNNAEAYYQRANIYKKLHLDHLAIKDYNRALEINPGLTKAYAAKGWTYLIPLIPVLLVLVLG